MQKLFTIASDKLKGLHILLFTFRFCEFILSKQVLVNHQKNTLNIQFYFMYRPTTFSF